MCEIRLTALRDPKGGYIICGSWIAFSLGEKVAFAKQMTDEGLPKGSDKQQCDYNCFYSLARIPSSVGFAASFPSEGEAILYLYASRRSLHKTATIVFDSGCSFYFLLLLIAVIAAFAVASCSAVTSLLSL